MLEILKQKFRNLELRALFSLFPLHCTLSHAPQGECVGFCDQFWCLMFVIFSGLTYAANERDRLSCISYYTL